MSAATIAARASGDWRFFERLEDISKTFTVRKYEGVLRWFATNWPANAAWPVDVPRPAASLVPNKVRPENPSAEERAR